MAKDNNLANVNGPREDNKEDHGEQLEPNGLAAPVDLGDRGVEQFSQISDGNGNRVNHGEQLVHNGFEALVELGDRDLEEVSQNLGDKSLYSNPKLDFLEARLQPPQGETEEEGRATFASNNSTNVTASSRKGGNHKVPTREYNLRNKLLVSSPIHADTYVITSKVDTAALRSMRMAANKNWVDQCEEEEIPPKHGAESGRR